MNFFNSYSYEQQDEFIANLFNHKKDGFFLDIACGHPILGNNTYTLDKNYGWNGLCVELGDPRYASHVNRDGSIEAYNWTDIRRAKFLQMDATSAELTEHLKQNVPSVVDYISLDVDAAGNNLALETLKRILDAGIKFKAMTFEHEIYLQNNIQAPSREILESRGYVRLFENVRLWGGTVINDEGAFSEDWWINPEYFESDILSIKQSGGYFFECAHAMKKYRNLSYVGIRHCSQAFPSEIDMFAEHGSHSMHGHTVRTPGWKAAPVDR